MSIGDLLLLCSIPIGIVCCCKFAHLYCMAIDEILQDISDAVNGRYESKYKNERRK